ncbi:MAG TPA: DUF748 domain-containing protein [Verrucomicrobiae bacterium]
MANEKFNAFKKTKGFRRLVWATVVLVVYSIVGFLVLPAVIKSQLIKRLPEYTKRQVSIADVKLNPFALSYTMRGFSLTETNGETFASLGEVYVNFELSSIFNGAWTLGTVSVKEPFAQVTRKADGTFNFDNLIPPADTNVVKEVKPLPAVLVELLTIEGGAVAFTDETRPGPFKTKIAPIQFDLTQLTTRPDKHSPYGFTASDDAGMKLSWTGRVSVQPPASSGTLKIEGVYLPKYANYAAEFFDGEIVQGKVNVDGKYGFSLAGAMPSVTLTNGLVQVRDLKVTAKGDTLVTLPTVDVKGIVASLEERSIKVGELATSGLEAKVVREKDGSINLLNLIKPQPVVTNAVSTNVTVVATSNAAPWRVALDSLQVANYSVTVEDRTLAKPASLKVDQVAVRVDGFQLTTNATLTTKVFARLNEAGTVEVSGPVHVFPPDGELAIELKEMDLRPLQPFAAPFVNVAIRSGLLSTSGKAQFALPASGAPKLTFKGDVKLDKFDTADGTEFQDFVKWEALAISGIQLQSEPQDLQVQEVKLKGLQTSLIIGTNKQSNIETILMTKAKTTNEVVAVTNQTASASVQTNASVVPVKLAKLVLEDGSLKFVDNSIQPHAVIAVQKFDVSVDGLSTIEEQPATVAISGRVDELAPFSVTGKVRPVLTNLLVDLVISNRNTDMTAFTPYMEKFGGYPITKGKVSVGLKYEIVGMALKSEHSVVVDQFTLGTKNSSPDAINLPLKLGVALLKDRHGKIELDLPVNGRLDDPQFRVLPVVMKVLVNLVTKAVASPFALLGKLVGGGEEMSFVAFEPGVGTIPEAEQAKMEKLAKALYERPGLNLEIAGAVEMKGDRSALAKLKFEQQLKGMRLKEIAATGVTPPSMSELKMETSERERLVTAAYVEVFGPLPVATNVVVATPVTNAVVAVATPMTNAPAVVKKEEMKPEVKSEAKAKKRFTEQLQGAAAQLAFAERKKKVVVKKPAEVVKKEEVKAVEAIKVAETVASTPAVPPVQSVQTTPTITLAEMEAKLLERVKVEDNELRDLMLQRAQSVQTLLLKTEKVTAERLFIITPKALDEAYRGESKVDLLLN